eukprot:GGOE01019214.1.p1 GENE.GGOE01019214.1~~GGOE01019214.1.p1  ORF type:complete len:502 (+),score=152.87 GGOE01019214.1:57-1508(+)
MKDWQLLVDLPSCSRLVPIALAVLCVLVIDVAAIATVNQTEVHPKFIAFVDGGSTGSRLHTFHIIYNSATSFLITAAGPSKKLNHELARLEGKTVEETQRSIGSLVTAAKVRVPVENHRTTPLFIWGTAGMRTLSEASQQRIYDTLHQVVAQSSHFVANRSHFQTITGREEGFYGWLAANYVHGINVPLALLRGPVVHTVGALDVGGVSAQAVFLPTGLTQFSHLSALQESLFIHSWLGLGAHHMDLLLKNTLMAEAGDDPHPVENPCSFPGSVETVGGRSMVGTGSFAQCLQRVQQQLEAKTRGGKPMALPASATQQEFWGMSLLYHATHFLSIVVPSMPFPRPSITDISAAGTVLCSIPWDRLVKEYDGRDPNTPRRRMFGRCFDAALTVALLGPPHGWGFPATGRQVRMVQNVSQLEVEWTLGAAVAAINALGAQDAEVAATRRHKARWLLVLSVALMLGYAAYHLFPFRLKLDPRDRAV